MGEKHTELCQELIATLDSNYNGKISGEELKEVLPDRADKYMLLADMDDNGNLDIEEVKQMFTTPEGLPDVDEVMTVSSAIENIKENRERRAKEAEEARLQEEFT